MIGDLTVGSKVCATDGTVTDVIGVYHRRNQPTYRLTWSDGIETTCDADLAGVAFQQVEKDWREAHRRDLGEKWTTAQIAERYCKQTIISRRIAIPVISAPVAFNVSNHCQVPSNAQDRAWNWLRAQLWS